MFFDKIGDMLRRWARDVAGWLDKLLQKLFRNWNPVSSRSNAGYGLG